MLSLLKWSLPLNKLDIKIDFKNLQDTNWDEVTEEIQLDVYRFRIDFKEDDVNKCRKVLPVILNSQVIAIMQFSRKLNARVAKISYPSKR